MPLRAWREYADLLEGPAWPGIAALNARRPVGMRERFVAQTRELLGDGLHYEQRIGEHGGIATRENHWHDLFNALVWLRHGGLKRALNARQLAEIARIGPKQRSRAQHALTQFDESGVLVSVRDPALLALWDAHDWLGLFWRERDAWLDGRIQLELFGHALLEQALTPGRLPVGKALVVIGESPSSHPWSSGMPSVDSPPVVITCRDAIRAARVLRDPQELRPLPLAGVPGWHRDHRQEAFFREADCFRPLRPGRRYPAPLHADMRTPSGTG